MYGKFFASTFTGSMFGAGPAVFAVWGYVIANTVDARVELNPKLLASILGTTEEAVTQAITELCEPDPMSRNPTDEGRRLQREGQYQYRVTSHEIYRAIRNEEDRRAYNREKQRQSRAKRAVKRDVIDITSMSTMSAHTEAEAEAEEQKDPGSSVQQAAKKRSLSTVRSNGRDSDISENGVEERAGRLVERYGQLFIEHRKGARFRGRPNLDWVDACDLCRVWTDDARLEKLAVIVLTTDDDFIQGTDRSFKIFAMKASWADDRLRQWEIQHGVGV